MVKIFVSFAFNGKEPFLQTITTEKIYRTEYTKSHKDHRSKKVGWGGGERGECTEEKVVMGQAGQ